MKLSIIFFAAVVLCVSAGPMAEVPAVRTGGTSSECQKKFKDLAPTYSSTCTSTALQFSTLAVTVNFWHNLSSLTMMAYLNVMSFMASNLDLYMYSYYPGTQAVSISVSINLQISYLTYFSQCMKATGSAQGLVLVQQATQIQASLTQVLTEIKSSCSSYPVGWYGPPIYTLISDSTLTMLIQATTSCQTFFTSCATVHSTASQTNTVFFQLMDIVNATTTVLKQSAQSVITTATSFSTATQVAVYKASISISVTAVSVSTVSCSTAMTVSKTWVQGRDLVLIGSMVFSSYQAGYIAGAVADLEASNEVILTETMTNITATNTEFGAMCENATAAQNISDQINVVTQAISKCVVQASASVSLTVQYCAGIAITAIKATQVTSYESIKTCVVEGKTKHGKDMDDIKKSYDSSCKENERNMTKCAHKHKGGPTPQNRSGPKPSDEHASHDHSGHSEKSHEKGHSGSDSGETSTDQCESCKKKHCDKDHKKHKEKSDEKCKKHKKGGENYEQVVKCREDIRVSTITLIQTYVAQFQVCASVTVQF